MRAFVTGATGFLGSHLVDRLLERGDEVGVLVRRSSNLRWLIGKKIQVHYGDVTGDSKGLLEGVKRAELVFHLAGVIRALKRPTYYEVNAQGTANVLEACLANPAVRRVVVVTSLAAHGPGLTDRPAVEEDECHPITDYGRSKRDAELITLRYQDRLPVTIVRPPAIYGPRDEQVLSFFRMVNSGLALLPGFGRRVLNLAHVDDVVTGIILAADSPKGLGEIFYVGEDRNYDWEEAARIMGDAVGRKHLIKIRAPGPFVYTFGALAEGVGRLIGKTFPLNIDYARNFMQTNWALDLSKARGLLGFRSAVSLAEGTRRTAEWYREEGWLR